MDKDLRYTYWNRSSEKLTGISEKDAIGKSLYDIFPDTPDTRRAEREYLDALRTQMPKTFINEYQLGGKDFFFEISAYPSKGGISVFARDITERKRAEEEILRLSNAVKMSTDSIIISDLDARIIDVNEATLKIYGTKDKNDLVGKNSIDIIASEDRERAFRGMKEVMEKGYIKDREYYIIIKGDNKIPIEMSSSIMKDTSGKPIGFVAIAKDITERKKSEERLQQYQLMVESAHDAIFFKDLESRYRIVNKKCLEIFGMMYEKVVGKNDYELMPDREEAKKNINNKSVWV
jgi:PAS domain S-box-containing protein